jgi:hypothetical protein
MNVCRKTRLLAAVLAIGFVVMCESGHGQAGRGRPPNPTPAPGAAGLSSRSGLIQANSFDRTDSQGFRWDIGPNGYIQTGTNSSLSQALTLSVNNSSFSSSQRMMTANGDEFVLSGRVSNVDVTRRIKIDMKAAAARYVEVLQNPTAAPMTAIVKLSTTMSRGQLQAVTTDSGMPLGSLLGPKDDGVIGLAQPNQGGVSCLFYLAESKSKVKPAIQNESNYRLSFTYTLTIPAGKTVAIMHGMAQRNLNSPPDSKTAAELFKPFRSRSWASDLPGDIRGSIQNGSGFRFSIGNDEIPTASLDSLDVEPGVSDILAVGERTRLRGVAACSRLSVKTRFGAYVVPFDKVAAIAGEQSARGGSRVFLRDGQVLCGSLELTDLRFAMNTGVEMKLTGEHLDRLVLHKDAQDGQLADNVFALLVTSDGNRLALVSAQRPSLAAATPWGERSIPLDEILRISSDPEQIGHWLRLKDGSRLFAFWGGTSMSVQTQIFGVQKFDARQVHSLAAAHVKAPDFEQRSEISVPHFILAGENVLVGRVDQSTIHFMISGQQVPVLSNQIRVMRNLSREAETTSGSASIFEAELWDGGNISGALEELVLPVRSADRVFSVRVKDIEEVRVPSPTVPDTMRVKIAQFLRDLGDPEFAKREAASKGLAETGYLAKSQLNEALSQVTDPEVHRRVQKLLDDLPD